MHDCLVLGSGRSGTSMVAGALSRSGYRMGDGLHLARASNPKGFFESPEVNGINEALLAPVLRPLPALSEGQRWLGFPQQGRAPRATAALQARMRRALSRRPFCHKDPRFCFTLPAWRPLLGATRFVCVFRHPALTARSMAEEVRRAEYLGGLRFDESDALELWTASYRSVLDELAGEGRWLFVHYDQVLSPGGLERIGEFLDADVDAGFPDSKLRRGDRGLDAPPEAEELYERLCERAGHRPSQAAPPAEGPLVTVVTYVGRGETVDGERLVEDVRAQRGARAELLVVDHTEEGLPELAGVRVLRPCFPSRGRALREALAAASGDFVAWHLPGARMLPSRLGHALGRLRTAGGPDLVTCDYCLHDDQGQYVDRVHPGAMGDAPGPFWTAGVVARRRALEDLAETAFFPVELALLHRLREEGRAEHVAEVGFSVHRRSYAEAWDASRVDAALVVAARDPFEGERPELSVSVCTYNRRRVLVECLEAFSRQVLRPGTFELVVVDDGSADGTGEMLAALELPVPLRVVSQPNGGLAAARNAGLEAARGRLVLFVNDDTIAFPDCVEQHLRAHAALGEETAVLGSFEQPPEALDNALLRYLERSSEVFGYSEMAPRELHDAFRFYTCNVSVPLDAVRRAGGFDPSFRHYGCEDTDLGLRLEALGYRVFYEPAARALHRHLMDFDYLRRRQQTVARAYVRFFRKHPEAADRWKAQGTTGEACWHVLRRTRGALPGKEAAARELARIDVGSLERLGGRYREAAGEVMTRLGELLPELNRIWWFEGYLEGFREHGVSGLSEVYGSRGYELHSDSARRLLAWPRWDEPEELDRLMDLAAPAAGFAALVLRHDARRDAPREAALAELAAAHGRRLGSGTELEVVLEEEPLDRARTMALGRSVDALLPLGGEPASFLAEVVAERLASAEDVARWRRRFKPQADVGPACLQTRRARAAPGRPSRRGRTAPEISVVVATRDRPRELAQLLERLALQDIGPPRFEVIVVDDGSAAPPGGALLERRWGFPLEILRQEGTGPAAARNLALARARGELVVFLNDDAVPAADNLRRHALAHRAHAGPVAVEGTFQLLPHLVTDPFRRHVETSNALFAQPLLKPGVLYGGGTLCTGNVSIRRDVLQACGGFDASFPYAGGEDTELGIRLERARGVRVLFDPRVRAGHDHAVGVRGYAARRRVLGWAAHRIEELHEGAGLVPGWPLAERDWERLRDELREGRPDHEKRLERAARICAEASGAQDAAPPAASLRALFDAVGDFEFRRGILAAHEGRRPEGRERKLEAAPAPRGTAGGARPLGGTAPAEPTAAERSERAGKPAAVAALLPAPAAGLPSDLERALAGVEGMVSLPEAQLLYELARGVRRGAIVEVGSYRGRSTVALGRGSLAGHRGPVYAVDPHEEFVGVLGGRFGPEDRGAFHRAMLESGCSEVVRLVNLSSEVLAPGWEEPVELLWLDGDHSYEGVARDFRCWEPHLVDGAVVAFDDATDRGLGPWRLIDELLRRRRLQPLRDVGKVRVFRFRAG